MKGESRTELMARPRKHQKVIAIPTKSEEAISTPDLWSRAGLLRRFTPRNDHVELSRTTSEKLVASKLSSRLISMLSVISLSISITHAQHLDSLAIEATGPSREFSYTNKETAFYYGETTAENTSSWQGFNVFGHEFLDDYGLLVDGEILPRSSAAKVTVYPDFLTREYPGGIVEQLRIVDGVALFGVMITSPKPIEVGIVPYFTDGRNTDYYEIRLSEATALVARKNHLVRDDRNNYPAWLAIHGTNFAPQLHEQSRGAQFSPVMLYARRSKTHIISFAVADTEDEALKLADGYAGNAARYFNQRRARMEKLLKETDVRTEDARFNKALAWAKLSLDALIMNQVTRGIFAGLPWFSNYWGRDTFISLPGAALVTGRFSEAKEILRSFAAYQQLDSTSTDYGRIPNIVTTTDKSYNTADGTPRFVMMAREYVERSGDSSFIIEVYPAVIRSIEGTLKHHSDANGYLVHGDAETWMDAVGPDGPWSPRGNRANDIQALWAQQLEAGTWFATRVGDVHSARRWNETLNRLKTSFARDFVTTSGVVDHLNADGSPDIQIRPNQIFAAPILDDQMRARVLKTVISHLTYPYGVASLSQDDENFHPYHQNEPYYPKDAAYHNGIVWTWLQGPAISELCRFGKQDLAYRITENSIHQILDRGAVGSQSELLDAIPRQGETEPLLSGTFSQAWNLAEFIRNFYDDYLGIRVARYNHHLVLRPKLPTSLGRVRATINLDGRSLPIEVDQSSETQKLAIDGRNLRVGGTATVELQTKNGRIVTTVFRFPPKTTLRLSLKDTTVTLLAGATKLGFNTTISALPSYDSILEPLLLTTPDLRAGLKALKGPDYPLLPHATVRSSSPSTKLLVDAPDASGDDVGTGLRPPEGSGPRAGAYTYPEHPAFVPGSFDITHFTVRHDDQNAYVLLKFRALSNPGWHPEYGFQLTYVAIAIDQDGVPGSGQRLVPRNANFMLDERHAYERLVLVGGGVQIEDQNGKILAAYVPSAADISDPLGDAQAGTITFAIPLPYLGTPTGNWTFTVLAGGQDDHGGSGLGEFRTVNKKEGEWNGGGRTKPNEANVYDVVVTQAK